MGEICRPKAHPRARQEAVIAFSEIEYGRGVRPDLSEANLHGANLDGADLSEANLSGANLGGADLSEANLSGADLSEADLSESRLIAAVLRGAVLFKANLSEAFLGNADLGEANLSGADLSEALFLTQERINRAFGNGATKNPEVLKRPEHWIPEGKPAD